MLSLRLLLALTGISERKSTQHPIPKRSDLVLLWTDQSVDIDQAGKLQGPVRRYNHAIESFDAQTITHRSSYDVVAHAAWQVCN